MQHCPGQRCQATRSIRGHQGLITAHMQGTIEAEISNLGRNSPLQHARRASARIRVPLSDRIPNFDFIREHIHLQPIAASNPPGVPRSAR